MTTITKAPAPQPLQADKLCKNYGKQPVLQDLDLTFEPGRIYGLIGRNGAGKTTLLGILSGQNYATGGRALYGGQPVWENSAVLGNLHFAREMSAASELAGLSVKNFLRAGRLFCPYWDQNYADELIKKFELPNKMINRLSRGQMSMVSITAALASRAPVTLLDEPTAGLDVVARERFYRILLDEYQRTGRTFVISTHIIEEAASVFEKVVILDEGKEVADQNTEDLVEQFRYISGPAAELDAALAERGITPLQTQVLGGHKMVAVRGEEALFEELAARDGLTVEGMNLQNVFVALCGHGDEEG
ncbi:ABC transporter ATP-binding protein [uncultured Gemmiger sp.]|uniref:ABC transporter ATP-binding protein n=1 Tax=uncultured Gemmiger sp. TaxID=1623490 RepID=UPI0025F86C93|nr:ABC transporter ATP-binding protein [uncultured Gemmiger sp.]